MEAAPPLRTRIRRLLAFKEGSIAIFLVLSVLLLLFLSIIGGLLLRPFFTCGLLTASGASLVFVATEASAYGAWHHNREVGHAAKDTQCSATKEQMWACAHDAMRVRLCVWLILG